MRLPYTSVIKMRTFQFFIRFIFTFIGPSQCLVYKEWLTIMKYFFSVLAITFVWVALKNFPVCTVLKIGEISSGNGFYLSKLKNTVLGLHGQKTGRLSKSHNGGDLEVFAPDFFYFLGSLGAAQGTYKILWRNVEPFPRFKLLKFSTYSQSA